MKQRILQVITSLLLIITLTMANFLVLGANVVAYAVDAISLNADTNHKNIGFMAYFKDERGNKITQKDTYANSNNLRLYFQISVKQEGYFNGNIVLNNANFKLDSVILSNGISKIENNIIYLNQINSGESKEIEVAIELIKEEQFDLSLLNMESKISLEGIYRDSTEKNISIKGERSVTLNLASPYTNADESIILSQEVITNKILNFNGDDKRVIQVEVKSGLNNSLFPIEKSIVNIQTPKISDKYPENVLVNSNDTLVSNGKELLADNWSYNTETGIININIENKQENNKVSWLKAGEDKFIITYIFDKEIKINNEKLNVNSQIELYDGNNTVISASSEITLAQDEKDAIVEASINQYETEIYKGKLYVGIVKDVKYKNVIDINLNNVANEILVKENKNTINEQIINSVYKTSEINKLSLDNILGENGVLEIINAETQNVISTVNKATQANENGKIIITYPENITEIIIKITNAEKIGKIEIDTTKTINSIDKNLVKEANKIDFTVEISYVVSDKENKLQGAKSNIILKETETSASLEINRTELSAMVTNSNVEFRITLNSKNENNELYKNPTIKLELPEKMQDIQVNSVKLLYEDEIKIESAVLEGKTIVLTLSGEQTNYKAEAIDGAIIIINANLTTSQKITSSTEQVKLTITNDNVINYKDNGIVIKNIDIVSYAGVITTNQILEYGIDVINNEGTKTGKLQVSTDVKNIITEKKIINNKENKISNVKILGTFPTREAITSNNIDMQVGNLLVNGIDANRVKVYYSNNTLATEDLENENNGWTEQLENVKNVKKYLVVVNELDIWEEVNLLYQITIPANLEYNQSAQEGYNVYYEDSVTNVSEVTKLDNVEITTGKGPVAEVTLKSYVGNAEVTEVRENEMINYTITVSNTGTEDMKNIQIISKVPENTVYVEANKLDSEMSDEEEDWEPFTEYQDTKNVEFNIEKLSIGETVTRTYQVKVKDGTEGNKVSNSAVVKYGEVSKTSNEVINNIQKGELETLLYSVDDYDEPLMSGYLYRYVTKITNISDKEKKDIRMNVNITDVAELKEIYYITRDEEAVIEKQKDYIDIESILPGEEIEICILVKIKTVTNNEFSNGSIFVEFKDDESSYNSNIVDMIIKSVNIETSVISNNSDTYVKEGDTIEYIIKVKNNGEMNVEDILVENIISDKTTLLEVLRNSEKLSENQYSKESQIHTGRDIIKIDDKLESGQEAEYKIKVVVNKIPGNKVSIEIIDNTTIYVDYVKIESKEIKHILGPETEDTDDGDNGSDDENTPNTPNKPGDEEGIITKSISGIVWLDENGDGEKDAEEQTLSDITVKLLDVKTNTFVKNSDGNEVLATTNQNGFYSFDAVRKGEYIVVFEYDILKYILTAYEKDGVDVKNNSKVINKTIIVDGQEKTVGATEIIEINNNNIANINMGLQNAKKYDLELEKFISKVVIQNSKGTSTKSYENTTFAKDEIDAKLINGTTVVVEYTIKVTNSGEVDAYVRKIADYISKDYKFTSELNKDWYQSGDTLYNTSLSNEKIKPSESKEVKLIVIKEMTENNTGLIHNEAEIVESYNELGLKDNNDNNSNSADLILSIKTGQIITTITLILTTIIMIGSAVFIIGRFVLNKRLI